MTQIRRGVRRVRDVVVTKHVAIEPTGANPIDSVLWIPVALLICDKKAAIGIQTDPVCRTKTVGQNLGGLAVGRNLEQRPMMGDQRGQRVPRTFGVIEIPIVVALQTHGELMEVVCYLVVIVEILIPVRLTVAVEVMQDADLISTANVNLPVNNLHPERLEEA